MAKDASTPDTTAADERGALLRRAYSNASTRLREENRDRFEALQVEEAQKLGLTYTPKPSKEARALAQAQALLAENPSIREALLGAQTAEPTPAS